jgi:hypothetical protein
MPLTRPPQQAAQVATLRCGPSLKCQCAVCNVESGAPKPIADDPALAAKMRRCAAFGNVKWLGCFERGEHIRGEFVVDVKFPLVVELFPINDCYNIIRPCCVERARTFCIIYRQL